METITTDGVLFVQLIWNSIHICLVWHGLVECSIKYSYLWYTRQCCLNSFNTLEVGWVVQWSELYALDNHLLYLWGDKYRLVEFLAAMHHAMTNCLYLFQRSDATNLLINQTIQNQLNTYSMLWHWLFDFHFLAICQFDLQESIRQTDFLYSTRYHYCMGVHIKKFVLNTATTAV